LLDRFSNVSVYTQNVIVKHMLLLSNHQLLWKLHSLGIEKPVHWKDFFNWSHFAQTE